MDNLTGLYDGLGVALDHTFTLLVGELNRAFKEVGLPLNHAQFVILSRVAMNDGISQADLSRCLDKDPAAVSRSLTYLESHGYIERRPLSGSKNGVFVTEKALAEKPRIKEAIVLATHKGCQGITPAEYEAGIAFLLRIQSNLKD